LLPRWRKRFTRRPGQNQLTGEQAKALDVIAAMLEHRQVTVNLDHLAILTLKGDVVVDRGHTRREHGQLQLRHGLKPFSVSRRQSGRNHLPRISGSSHFPCPLGASR
jgi:hypothetical protein